MNSIKTKDFKINEGKIEFVCQLEEGGVKSQENLWKIMN